MCVLHCTAVQNEELRRLPAAQRVYSEELLDPLVICHLVVVQEALFQRSVGLVLRRRLYQVMHAEDCAVTAVIFKLEVLVNGRRDIVPCRV